MKIIAITRYLLAASFIFPIATQAEESQGAGDFSTLNVSDNSDKTKDKAVGSSPETYRQPGAYSSRVINQNQQSLDASLRSMAGTYTQLDPMQGTVDVNVRGMNGLGRVNTMVDGVTQTYFGMAATGYHFGANSAAGTLIDPDFLAEIDVVRGSSSGSYGVNALAGSVNMRTIDVDDVVRSGNQAGVLSRFSVGDNGTGRSGMIAVAGKTEPFSNGGGISALVGISGKETYATYKNGAGRDSKDFIGEDTQFMKQNPQSQLYKLNVDFDAYNKLQLGGRHYSNTFTRRDITSDDYFAKYSYAPQNELIDFKLQLSTSRSEQDYEPEALYNVRRGAVKNRSNAIDASNTSRFSFAGVDTEFLLGGKITQTKYTRTFQLDQEMSGNAYAPSGKQDISALYTGFKFNRDIWQLEMDLNYTQSKVSGYKPACADDMPCFPRGAATLHVNDYALNPAVTLSAQATPWLQPFVSYSHSSRAPNVQEVFFANEGGASMNPFLKPERAETWQAGFNIIKQGLLTEKDSLHMKALTYQSRIKNYIVGESFFLCYSGELCHDIDNSSNDFNAHISTNSLTPVHTNGYELELNYDVEFAYLNLSWSKQHTDQPTSITSTTQSFGYGDINDLPRTFATVDVGTRWFDQSLVVGAIVKYTGRSKRLSTEGIDLDSNRVEKESMPRIPTIVDIYSSYAVTDNVKLRLTVQNVGNKDYAEALNRLNQDLYYAKEGASVNTTARGRTWVFGGEINF